MTLCIFTRPQSVNPHSVPTATGRFSPRSRDSEGHAATPGPFLLRGPCLRRVLLPFPPLAPGPWEGCWPLHPGSALALVCGLLLDPSLALSLSDPPSLALAGGCPWAPSPASSFSPSSTSWGPMVPSPLPPLSQWCLPGSQVPAWRLGRESPGTAFKIFLWSRGICLFKDSAQKGLMRNQLGEPLTWGRVSQPQRR